ncbi:MAG: thioredoxin domain-containing protein, partial [Thermoanaerobaculia bacterium]
MKQLAFVLLALFIVSAAIAADEPTAPAEKPGPALGARADKLIKDALPVCADTAKETRVALQHKLPPNMIGTVVRIDSPSQTCAGQWVAITSTEGEFFMGTPWFLDDAEGTLEQKIKNFTLQNMKQVFEPVVDRTKTRAGLYRATLYQAMEGGRLPLEGEIDPNGTVFFFGHFVPIANDYRVSRLKPFEQFIAKSPTEGSAKPEVTVIEFSDFECPSCQRASGWLKPILAAHSDKVRYIRYDTPLMSVHPWALPAAIAGRAVWRQKPDLFWTYKEKVYENQEKLSAFTIDDFARGFAQDHDLDLAKYDADVKSPEVATTIVNGVGTAFSNDVRATPTYFVNGAVVDPGPEGKKLAEYV